MQQPQDGPFRSNPCPPSHKARKETMLRPGMSPGQSRISDASIHFQHASSAVESGWVSPSEFAPEVVENVSTTFIVSPAIE